MIRKIIKIGNSDGITIPVGTMHAHKFKVGDRVEIYIGKPGSDIKYLELLVDLEKFKKQYSQALQNLADR